MEEIIWKEPPPEMRGRPSKYRGLLEPFRAKPNTWGILESLPAEERHTLSSRASYIRRTFPDMECAVRTGSTEPDLSDLYVRYVPNGAQSTSKGSIKESIFAN